MKLAWIGPWSLGLREQAVQHHGQRDVAPGASRETSTLGFNPAPGEAAPLPSQAQMYSVCSHYPEAPGNPVQSAMDLPTSSSLGLLPPTSTQTHSPLGQAGRPPWLQGHFCYWEAGREKSGVSVEGEYPGP